MARGGTATGRIPADLPKITFTEGEDMEVVWRGRWCERGGRGPLARPAKANSIGIFIFIVFLFRFYYRTSYCLHIFLTEIIGESFKKNYGKVIFDRIVAKRVNFAYISIHVPAQCMEG